VRIRVGARVGLKNKEERYKISNNSKDETLATKNKKKRRQLWRQMCAVLCNATLDFVYVCTFFWRL